MKKVYIVSCEDMPEAVFPTRADAEEYVLHESYYEALNFLNYATDEERYWRFRHLYSNSYVALMIRKSEIFYIEEVDFYE